MVNHASEPIRVMVRSRPAPVEILRVEVGYPTPLGQIPVPKRFVRYERILDAEQEAVLEAARALARRTGAPLRVIDLTQEHLVTRVLRRLGRLAVGVPRVSVPASVLRHVADKRGSVP